MNAAQWHQAEQQQHEWLEAIRGRLARGPATTAELAKICGCDVRGPFGPFLYEQLKAGTFTVTEETPFPRSVWELK